MQDVWTATRHRALGLLLAMILTALGLWVDVARAGTVFISPTGSDAAQGDTAASAVATLNRAIGLAQASGGDAKVVVLPGTYANQSVQIDARRISANLAIQGMQGERARYPVFVGSGSGTFLRVYGTRKAGAVIVLRRLRIARYATAISIEAARNRPSPSALAVIADNVFDRIGAIGSTDARPSTAAIRLVNASGVLIARNVFLDVFNGKQSDCPLLHPIYLAHFSSGTRIVGNTFDGFCGSAIKLRDRSNGTLIFDNRFERAGDATAIEEWFCDKARTTACTKPEGECPSTVAVIGRNRFAMPLSQQVQIRGQRERRSWCSERDYTSVRISVDETRDIASLLSGSEI